jgi:cell division protein ZapA (FtsZ GTPase activity inhibitor)
VPTIQLSDPSAGALFTISESNWTAISKRVGITILANAIAPIIGQTLSEFPKLEIACQAWANTTFPGLVNLSANIGRFAATAAADLRTLQGPISQLNPGDAVPQSTANLVKTTLGTLAQQAQPLNSQCNALDAQVQAFATENQIVDAQVENYIKYLGPNWQSLASDMPAVETAAGRVEGAWTAITNDFNAIATNQIQITTTLLLSLDLQSAVLAWTNLGPEAAAFASMAQGQQQYLTGAWLTASR